MKNTTLLTIAVMLVTMTGCLVTFSGIKGSGVIISETRELAEFDSIELKGSGTLRISMGDACEVTVTVDDNLMDLVETKVYEGQLIIRQTQNINPQDELLVEVVLPELHAVDCSGAGSVELVEITSDALAVGISGACSLNGTGDVNELELDVSGAGSANLDELMSKTTSVRLSGAASAKVYASESFDGSVSGVGSVKCYGHPANVERSISGVGSIEVIE